MIRILIFIFFIAGFSRNVHAQGNFVKNGGFDTLSPCPSGLSQIYQASWNLPTLHAGSSDLFNVCATNASVGVPSNFRANNCPAFNGGGYVGGYLYLNASTYKEYICDTLKAPLVAGRIYIVSFMYKLADMAALATDDLGFYLSVNYPAGNTYGALGVVPTSQNTSGNFLTDQVNWQLYTDTIVALGGEEYITLGGFDSISNSIVLDSTSTNGWAYYYYDSVSIYEFYGIEQPDICLGETAFPEVDTAGVDSLYWDFDDPSSGALNNSTLFFPQHLYQDSGTYTIKVVRFFGSVTDTLETTFQVYPRQSIQLGLDTLLCREAEFTLYASQPFSNFLWQDLSTADSFVVDGDTVVYVTVFGACDTVSDTLRIMYDDSIRFDLGPDTTLCGGSNYLLDSKIDVRAQLLWSTGDTTLALNVLESGTYTLNAQNACGAENDTVKIIFKPIPSSVLLPADTVNCFDNAIVLTRPDLDSTTYVWSDSTKKKTYTVDTTETVWLAAFNDCGITVDTMRIVFNGEIESDLGSDTIICNLDSLVLNAHQNGATYVWNTGDTADSIVASTKSQLYIVTITLRECQTIESKRVDLSDVFCPSIDCRLQTMNVFTPNADGVNDIWRATSDCEILSYQLNIYNRWGQLVHSSANAEFGWDGFIDGVPASEGTYFFELQFRDTVVVDVDRQGFKGFLTLIR